MRKEYFDEFLKVARRHKTKANINVHIALLMRGKRIVAMAKNRIGTRTSGSGFNNMTIHAEVAVIKKLGDISQLRGLTLVVLRYGFEPKTWTESHPCPDCMKFLNKCFDKYGLNRVYYSPHLSKA
jgi:hypothetical protein